MTGTGAAPSVGRRHCGPYLVVLLVLISLILPPAVALLELGNLSVTAPTQRSGEVETWRVSFSTPQIDQSMYGRIGGDFSGYAVATTFPEGTDLSGAVACSIEGATGVTTSVSGRVVTCTIGTGTWQPGSNMVTRIANVKNRPLSQAATLAVDFANHLGVVVASGSESVTISTHPFSSLSFTTDTSTAGAVATYQFSFRLFNPWPADGCVSASFSEGVSLDAGLTHWTLAEGASGSLGATTIQGREARACREGGTSAAADTLVRATLSNVQLPLNSEDPVEFILTTWDALVNGIDSDALYDDVVPDCLANCEPPPPPPPPPPGAPEAPGGLSATTGTVAGSIALAWSEPPGDGGSDIIGFRVYRAQAAAGPYVLIKTLGPVLTYADSGLGNDVKRFYQVAAFNENGEGERSNTAEATTRYVSPSPTPRPTTSGPPRVDPLDGDGGYSPGSFEPSEIFSTIKGTPPVLYGAALVLIVLGWAGAGGYVYWRRRRMRLKP